MADIEKNLREIAQAKGLKISDFEARIGTTVSNLLTRVKCNTTVSKIQNIVETMELFCLLHDPSNEMFHLSVCYSDGEMKTIPYDNMEYCSWRNDVAVWDVQQATEAIINGLERTVHSLLRKA